MLANEAFTQNCRSIFRGIVGWWQKVNTYVWVEVEQITLTVYIKMADLYKCSSTLPFLVLPVFSTIFSLNWFQFIVVSKIVCMHTVCVCVSIHVCMHMCMCACAYVLFFHIKNHVIKKGLQSLLHQNQSLPFSHHTPSWGLPTMQFSGWPRYRSVLLPYLEWWSV